MMTKSKTKSNNNKFFVEVCEDGMSARTFEFDHFKNIIYNRNAIDFDKNLIED